MWYLCNEHRLAYDNRMGWNWHGKQVEHIEPLDLEASKSQEVPEGYEIIKQQTKKPGPQPKSRDRSTGGETRTTPPEAQGEPDDLESLPTEPPELYYSLLRLKGVPEPKARQMQREFKLSPWAWEDAQEITGMLKSAGVTKSNDWIHSFLKQYGYALQSESKGGLEFISRRGGGGGEYFGSLGGGRRDDFFGGSSRYEMSPLESTFERYIRFQMARDMGHGREEEPEGRAQIPVELQRKIEGMERENAQLAKFLEDLLKKQEEEKHEREISELRQMIMDLKSQPASGNTDLLQRAQEEREKRMEDRLAHIEERNSDTIRQIQDRLDQAREELRDAKRQAESARVEAINEERQRRTDLRSELESSGYIQRAKSPEEKWMDVIETQVTPGLGTELKRVGNVLERVADRLGPAKGESPLSDVPISTGDADALAQLMTIEAEMAR